MTLKVNPDFFDVVVRGLRHPERYVDQSAMIHTRVPCLSIFGHTLQLEGVLSSYAKKRLILTDILEAL